jgi:hypothetical protein
VRYVAESLLLLSHSESPYESCRDSLCYHVTPNSAGYRSASNGVPHERTHEMRVTVDAKVKRGPESWSYIYITLGFVLSIEGTIVGMTPLVFPWNIITYAIVAIVTGWFWTESGWLHNKLIGLKNRYETKPR